eukprot:10080080-Alexandrium_andersonii.AAC.1
MLTDCTDCADFGLDNSGAECSRSVTSRLRTSSIPVVARRFGICAKGCAECPPREPRVTTCGAAPGSVQLKLRAVEASLRFFAGQVAG